MNILSKKGINVDIAICISLKTEHKRREETIRECNKIGLPVKFFLADLHPDGGVEGCKDSHKKVIQYAKDNNFENILVLEDDVLFDEVAIKNMKPLRLPNNIDMLYLGYHINRGLRISDQLLKLESGLTTHAYIMNKNVYDIFLNYIDKEWDIPEFQDLNQFEKPFFGKLRAVDMFYAKYIHHARGKTFGIYPMIAYQRPEYSQIEKAYVDYKNLFIQKANYFANKINSKLRCEYVQTDEHKIINFIKNSNAYDYDYFYISPRIVLNPYNKEINNKDWDVLYIKDDEYLIRKQASYKRKDTWRIKHLYPGCTLAPKKEWLPERPVLCFYGEDEEKMKQLSEKYELFYCNEKYKEITKNSNGITLVPKHKYNFIPTNQVLLKNDITFFVDHIIRKPNIILWMTKDTFDHEWKCDWWQETGIYKLPFDGKSLFKNMSRYILSIIFDSQEICDRFCDKYDVIYNPKNMLIISNGKHDHDINLINPIPWKIIAKTNGNNFIKYIQTYQFLKKQNDKFTMELYGCSKSNKKRFRNMNISGIKCLKGDINWENGDIFLMLENDENLYWKSKMSSCFVLTNEKYSYMNESDILIEESLPKMDREELKRNSIDYALKEKGNENEIIDFFIKS